MTKVSNKKVSVPTVSTSDLLAKVAAKFDSIPKRMTKDIVSSFLTEIEESIGAQNKVRIDKVGILQVKDRAARKGRNPQTGEEIKIPASKKVSFRVASSLKEAVGVKKKKAATSSPLDSKKKR